jgi:hypothetical protein
VGDNARKGAVKKSQVKTRLGAATAWTKHSKKSGEFMAVKEAGEKDKGGQKIQGRAGGEEGREKEKRTSQRSALIGASMRMDNAS